MKRRSSLFGQSDATEDASTLDDPQVFLASLAGAERQLRSYIRRFTRDVNDEQDLLEDCIAIAWIRRDQFKARGSAPAWMRRICQSVCRRWVIRETQLPTLPLLIDPSHPCHLDNSGRTSQPGEDERVEDERLADERLADERLSLVLRLPLKRRQAVLLRYLGGLSTRQAAETLRCREGTVKAALHQARVAIRAQDPRGGHGTNESGDRSKCNFSPPPRESASQSKDSGVEVQKKDRL